MARFPCSRISARRLRRGTAPLPVLLLTVALSAPPVSAQGDGVRVGLTMGGVSFLGVTVEFLDDDVGLEVGLGTWGFRDVAVSVTGRHYFGGADARPVAGLGLWTVIARPEGQRWGSAVVARAPIGVEWAPAGGRHALAAELNVNRGLWVRRTDPEDETPLNRRLVPLPGLAYRYRP